MRAQSDPHAKRRAQASEYLRGCRDTAGPSQGGLAVRLGGKVDVNFISQIENGYAVIPEYLVAEWADAVGVDRTEFCITVMAFFQPGYATCLRPAFDLWKNSKRS